MNKRSSREHAEPKYREPDRIQGTSKVRTYGDSDFLYSKESSIEKITGRKERHEKGMRMPHVKEDYKEPDRIQGTSKVRTYGDSDFLYSKESSIEKITGRKERHEALLKEKEKENCK